MEDWKIGMMEGWKNGMVGFEWGRISSGVGEERET